MSRWVPVEAFEHAGHAVFVSGEDGRVEYCNSAMAELLKLDRADIVGHRCWEIMRLRSPAGTKRCRAQSRCPIQSDVRIGPHQVFRPALLSVKGGDPIEVDLLAFAVSPPVERRCAILHVIKIAEEAGAVTANETSDVWERAAYSCLSQRELEVMRHLAKGESTNEIADSLFVSPATVRNHVRAILCKLKVHSRIEAITLPVRRRSTRSAH
jgi:DNA-binding CsgD family transcriptional regulator